MVVDGSRFVVERHQLAAVGVKCYSATVVLVVEIRRRDASSPTDALAEDGAADLIDYKFAVLVYRCLQGMTPPYLANSLQRVSHIDTGWRLWLHSVYPQALVVPSTRLFTVSDRAFYVTATRTRNRLPDFVTSASPNGTSRLYYS